MGHSTLVTKYPQQLCGNAVFAHNKLTNNDNNEKWKTLSVSE